MELHPHILQKNGISEFVVLSFEEYENLREQAELYEDLMLLRAAKNEERNAPTLTLAEARAAISQQ